VSPIRKACLSALFIHVFAAPALPVWAETGPETQNVTGNLGYVEDTTGQLTREQIARAPESSWRKIGSDATRFSFSRSVFWLRFNTNSLRKNS